MKSPLALRPADLHEDRREEMEASERKILAFMAAVFVISAASVASSLPHLEQSAFAAITVGLFAGATATGVGWFGERNLFGEDGDE